MLRFEDALKMHDFSHRAPIYLSPDGGWIAYTVRSYDKISSARGAFRSETDVTQELIGSQVWVTDIQSGHTQIITEGWNASSWAGAWSPDGSELLFVSDKENLLRVWKWNPDLQRAELVCNRPIRSPWGYDAPIWSRDGSSVLVRLLPHRDQQTEPLSPEENHPVVKVFSTGVSEDADSTSLDFE